MAHVDLQAIGNSSVLGELYLVPFLRGVGRALGKGRVLFLVTTSILPSPQVYAELHALSSLWELISLVDTQVTDRGGPIYIAITLFCIKTKYQCWNIKHWCTFYQEVQNLVLSVRP